MVKGLKGAVTQVYVKGLNGWRHGMVGSKGRVTQAYGKVSKEQNHPGGGKGSKGQNHPGGGKGSKGRVTQTCG